MNKIINNNFVIIGVTYCDIVKKNLPTKNNNIEKNKIKKNIVCNNLCYTNITQLKKQYICEYENDIKDCFKFYNEKINRKNNDLKLKINLCIDDSKNDKRKFFLDQQINFFKIQKDFFAKKIKINNFEKQDNNLKALMLYNSLKQKLNFEINKFNKDKRNVVANTNNTIYLTILMESLSKTYTEVTNKLSINKQINIVSNTVNGRRLNIDANNINDLNITM